MQSAQTAPAALDVFAVQVGEKRPLFVWALIQIAEPLWLYRSFISLLRAKGRKCSNGKGTQVKIGVHGSAFRLSTLACLDDVQASTNTILLHFLGIVFANWTLRILNKDAKTLSPA